ncbi:uncharacterized protein TRUGW13939_07083 [Talaromyces rugulosus]|uniref:PH domain-containing protein n=1 Tax=Talaromyces rugulosus TaxID=121627 RepID=A0A7H8R2T1_TALRU|nr:uncharacterized protein TRUGW13939_07083 [Talaromyces rugulosus]QKX59941.1 hypothetical protein TRUGW13939_07083 [Talaromyces rugulosus]
MDAQPAPRSGIPRRGPPLAPIRTDLSQQLLQQQQLHQQKPQLQQPQKPKQLPTLQKPRPNRLRPAEPTTQQAEKVPPQPEPATRKPSKSSLKSLFSRNKAVRDVKKKDNPLPQVSERRESDAQSIQPPETPRSFAGTVTSVTTVVASADLTTPIATPTEPHFEKKGPIQTAKAKPTRKSSSPWVPPPLFQAYPQALKHATLFAPILSAEAILRIQSSKTTAEAKEENSTPPDSSAAKKKDEKDKKHARRMSMASGDTLLARKIFVLVTSGRLLQYAAEGRHDRLPEKLMRLGSTSAAFASDAIPGKPFVIQVTQQFSSDGKAPTETTGRGLLSRFGIQGSDARRMVRTFLMVLSDPEEMNSWLVSLRMTIESVGGKHFVPESPVEDKNAAAGKINQATSSTRASRQLNIRRPSLNDFSSQHSGGSFRAPSRTSIAPTMNRKNSYQDSTPSTNLAKALSRRSITAPSDAISIATTATMSMEPDTIYEDPRDAPLPPTRTPTISQPPSLKPSPATSPVQSPPTTPRLRNMPTIPSSTIRPSMYAASPPPQPDHRREDPAPSRRLSYISSAHSPPQSPSASPIPPNFSVPSFSTRFTIPRRGSGPSVNSDTDDPPTGPSSPVEQTEPRRKYSGLNIDMGRIAAANMAKRSLATEARSNTPNPISPTKSSLPGPRGIPLHTTPSQPSSRYAHKVQSPEISQKPSASDARAALPTPQKSRPLMRLPKPNEPDTLTALPSFAQSAPGTDRIKRTSVTTATPSRPPSQIVPPSLQAPRIPSAVGQRASRMAIPASKSPPVGITEQERQPTRRLSALPQQRSISPRKKSIPSPSLAMSPPAPPPDCPLPEVPSDIPGRRLPTWRKHSLLPAPNMDARKQQSPELRQIGFARRQQISPPTPTSSIPRHDPHGP